MKNLLFYISILLASLLLSSCSETLSTKGTGPNGGKYSSLNDLQNKTLHTLFSMTIDGVDYSVNSEIILQSSVDEESQILSGTVVENGVTYATACIKAPLNSKSYTYYCSWFYATGEYNNYLFSVNPNDSIVGDYAYASNGENGLTKVSTDPDATLMDSYISTNNQAESLAPLREYENQDDKNRKIDNSANKYFDAYSSPQEEALIDNIKLYELK